MMEFNYLVEHGALTRQASGRYAIDYARMPATLSDLAKELLTMEATGDRERVENWFKKYGAMPAELKSTLQSAASVPVDIDPVFSFKDTVR
jgi:hypothetical protein